MKLNSLTPVPGSTKNRKRVGRGHGSGLGKSAGRGDKGAGQRSGFKRRPWFEGGQMPLARRLPRRGFTNILGIEKIDAQIMFQKGLVRSSLKPIKILGDGELNMKLEVTASAFSTSAKEKIEKAGGTATVQ